MKKRTEAAAFIIAAMLVLPTLLGIAGLFRAPVLPFAAADSARAAAITASLGGEEIPCLSQAQEAYPGERTIVRFRDGAADEAISAALETAGLEYSLPADSAAKLFVVCAPETHRFFTDNADIILY
ncbi:MAG: hypothetical protein IKX92_07055, partial [Clostridia bacterium]|nr:hypothetical protein [Clostridia bacterium]